MKQTITILDGGMGQELIKRSSTEVTPLWSTQVMMDEPDIVRDLHTEFIHAGAKVITVNAYTMTPERLQRDGNSKDFESLQLAAVSAATSARQAAGVAGVRIAGCLPPLVASYHTEVAPEYEAMLKSYERIVAIQSAFVDVFLCETMSSIDEAKAALVSAKKSGLPVWVSLCLQDNNNSELRSGESLTDAVIMLQAHAADGILLNCCKPETVVASWSKLENIKGLTGAYANGFTSVEALKPGGTVTALKSRTDLDPNAYADYALKWVTEGAALVGGCCEVGPEHIKATVKKLIEAGYSV